MGEMANAKNTQLGDTSHSRKKPLSSAPLRDSGATKGRILEAAKVRFSQQPYEEVGVREIAGDAGADPALVIRYFGSKEQLFHEIAASAFEATDLVDRGVDLLPESALKILLAKVNRKAWRQGYDPFRFLLCSVSSATAGPIVAHYFAKNFIKPLAAQLKGRHVETRAALIASYVLGFAMTRFALVSPSIDMSESAMIERLLGEALKACVDDQSRDRRGKA